VPSLTTPLVTVCIPTYNGAVHLRQCLDSVLAQTYGRLDVLVVDDCSQDDTVKILGDYERRDDRLRVTQNPTNVGLVQNWERCAALAKGEYIKFAFQDDVLLPTCVERLAGAMRDGVRFAFCAREFIADDEPSRMRAAAMDHARGKIGELFADRPSISPVFFAEAILTFMPTNIVGEPTVTLMHRDVLAAYGGFNHDLLQLVDLELWCRIAVNESTRFVPEVLAQFRVHAGSATSSNVARRSFRVESVDPLVLLHEFAFSPYFAELRRVARSRRPPMDLADLFYERAYVARGVARNQHRSRDADRSALDALEALSARYPALTGPIPLRYALAREWRAIKRRLRPVPPRRP
jgi:glycosyltransferase involved in cell wall biosynthesis